jgi:acetyl esterase/lipase
MQDLIARAEKVARLLKHRRENVAVAESSTGGLIAAALLALPGASAYFLGGAVVYTQVARRALLDVPDLASLGVRAATEPYALLLAQTARRRFSAHWAWRRAELRVRPATDMAIRPATAASPLRGQPNVRSRSKRAAVIGSATCMPSRPPHSSCCWTRSRPRRAPARERVSD